MLVTDGGPPADRLQQRGEELQALAAKLAAGDADLLRKPSFSAGESVWAREKGWPAWPALVVTQQDAAACPALLGTRSCPSSALSKI